MFIILNIVIYVTIIYTFAGAEPISGYVEPAEEHEFPYVVSIGRTFDIPQNNPFGHTCGGALITKRFVLTSASCFLEDKTASDYFIYFGSGDLSKSRKFGIKSWISYDCWLKSNKRCHPSSLVGVYLDNDIAIVELTDKVDNTLRPIKVSNVSPRTLVGQNVTTAGWGLLFNDTIPQHMLKADLRVISNEQCLQNVRNVTNDPNYYHEENSFCTNGAILFAVLDDGDRGSPVFMKQENGDYKIVGFNQEPAPSSVNDIIQLPDQQNKHISVHYYIDFIKAVAKLQYLRS